jgi:hypothetical protein
MANKPNNPSLWSKAKSLAKQKFDVYPSAYANGWAAKWYKGKGGTWRKAEYGMEIPMMADGGKPNWLLEAQLKAQGYSGNALQQKMSSMAQGGEPQNAGFQALPEYVQAKIIENMAYGGMAYPFMADGGEANGEMAMGQMAAVSDKMSKLLKFIKPDENLDPWIASKLAVMDHSADAISDYLMYGPEASEQMEKMKKGGYVVSRSNDRKGKTHKVTGPDGTVKYFGDSKLGQHPRDPERKKAFYARHKKNLDKNPYFRAFARATWQDGGELENMPSAEEIIQAYADYSAMSVEAIVGELQQRSEEEQEQLLMQMYQEIVQADQQDMPEAQEEYEEDVEEVDEEESSEQEVPAAQEESSSADDDDEDVDYSMIYGRGGYIDYNGRRQRSKTPTWSGNAGYAYGGYIPEFMPTASYRQGGPVVGQEMEVSPAQLEQLRAQGYEFEIL